MIPRPRLTKEAARAAKAEAVRYDLKDAPNGVAGLRLTVFPSGIKTWSLRYDVAGQDRRFTIGPYSENGITLAKARDLAKDRLLEVKDGRDPAREKAETRRKVAAGIDPDALFSTAWGEWEKAPKPKSRNLKGWQPSTADRVQKLYANELEPRWGKRRLSEISNSDVSGYLDKIAKTYPHAAARRLRVIASFFNWCVAKTKLTSSPCDGLEGAKHNKGKRKLTNDELRWLWLACGKDPFPFGYIVRLLILTLGRRNEVAGIRDRELRFGNHRTWILPKERTKNHHEHHIYLTDAMIEIIKAIPRVKNKEGLLFTTNARTPFSGFSKAKKGLDARMLEVAQQEDPEINFIQPWKLHDLRRTSASRMQRLAENNVVEACLNHIDDDEYLQDGLDDQKIKAFDAWSREMMRIVERERIEAPALVPVS